MSIKKHLPHRNVPVRAEWLKNKARRQAEEVVLLALAPVPIEQNSFTNFLIYEISITAHFYFKETA